MNSSNIMDLPTKSRTDRRIIGGMYGLPQSGILANKLLKVRLATRGYEELPHTPGLFKHKTRPVWFTLVVDDFGIKYIGRENAEHLIETLKDFYEVEVDRLTSRTATR